MELNDNNTTISTIQKFLIRYKLHIWSSAYSRQDLTGTFLAPKQSFDSKIFNIHKKVDSENLSSMHLRAESVSGFSRGCQSVSPEIWILKLKLLNERVLLSVFFLQHQRHKCKHLALADFWLARWTKNVLVFWLKCYIALKCPKKKSKSDDAKCLH